jgi:hypothetical protein
MAQDHLQELMESLRNEEAHGRWRRITVRVASVLLVAGIGAACSGASSVATPDDSGAADVAGKVCSPGRSVACVGARAAHKVCVCGGVPTLKPVALRSASILFWRTAASPSLAWISRPIGCARAPRSRRTMAVTYAHETRHVIRAPSTAGHGPRS